MQQAVETRAEALFTEDRRRKRVTPDWIGMIVEVKDEWRAQARLHILSEHLKARPTPLFNLDQWFNDDLTLDGLSIEPACRTCACIGGEALFLFAPREKIYLDEIRAKAQALLGLTEGQAYALFMPNEVNEVSDEEATRADCLPVGRDRSSITPQEAARVIDHLIETGEVDWRIIR